MVQVWEPQLAKAFLAVDYEGRLIEKTVPLVFVYQQSFLKILSCPKSLVLA